MNKKHGLGNHSIYALWQNMRSRCYREDSTGYKNYGGRGIEICKEWHDFMTFYNWVVTHGYQKGLTIDRINNDGNYNPGNCRFTTYKVQANNKRQNIYDKRVVLKRKKNQWVIYLLNKGKLINICQYNELRFAIKDIKLNRKHYLESI